MRSLPPNPASTRRVSKLYNFLAARREPVVKKLRFVISLPNDNSYQREQAKAARETADRMGAEVQILDAKNDAVTQSSQVLEFIQSPPGSRPDAVLFEPLTTTGLVRPAEAAVASGIGWVVLNSDVEYLDRLRNSSGLPIFGVTRDHREIGRLQARQFAALLPQGGTVLYVQGPSNNHAAIERTAGMESQKAANIHVQSLRCKWDEGSAYQAVSAWLQLSTNGANINIVGCQYDGIARGAKRAFEDLRDRAGRERFQSVPFTGVDGLTTEGRAWVEQGILAATVILLLAQQRLRYGCWCKPSAAGSNHPFAH